jgi:antitoxin (DNA-binding transcriptional repressor) of toxin-antitoxin stability system
MKAVNTSELKNHLSRYLRMARRGERVTVLDREEPVAELAPIARGATSPWDALLRDGRLVLGTQDWDSLVFSPLSKSISVQELLDPTREDPV